MKKKRIEIILIIVAIAIILIISLLIGEYLSQKPIPIPEVEVETEDIPEEDVIDVSEYLEETCEEAHDHTEVNTDSDSNAIGNFPSVLYGDTKVYTAEDMYEGTDLVSSNICYYVWRELNQYVNYDCTQFIDYGYVEHRGPYLAIIRNTENDKKLVYVEVDCIEENVCYVKISNNFNKEIDYYKFTLLQTSEEMYDIDAEKVSFEDISKVVSNFTDTEVNKLVDNRAYAQDMFDFYTNAYGGEFYWEGYEEPVTVDMLMEILFDE